MKIIKVIYDNNSEFILEIVEKFACDHLVETFSLNNRKQVKAAKGIQTEMGSKNLPLISVEDENQEIVGGIYSENTTNWEDKLTQLLKELE